MTDSAHQSARRLPDEDESAWKARIKRIRDETVRDTLESLGFNMDDVTEIQKDIMFLRKLRVASETAGAKTLTALFGALLAVIGALATLAVQHFTAGK